MIKGSGGAARFNQHHRKIGCLCSRRDFSLCNLTGRDHIYAHVNSVVALATAARQKGGAWGAVWVEVDRRTSAGTTGLEAGHREGAKNRHLNPQEPSTDSN